ncbi:unnamed protein product [Ambrosiozyma monospora]|uniref:Unnamed protein product n=1 Tax=Ambrosiozyma monospora TaxID=43982 RepID=A0A9W7DFE0_AMBMO|nr:unnamed protein product [Ambrosiozyma monospora]
MINKHQSAVKHILNHLPQDVLPSILDALRPHYLLLQQQQLLIPSKNLHPRFLIQANRLQITETKTVSSPSTAQSTLSPSPAPPTIINQWATNKLTSNSIPKDNSSTSKVTSESRNTSTTLSRGTRSLSRGRFARGSSSTSKSPIGSPPAVSSHSGVKVLKRTGPSYGTKVNGVTKEDLTKKEIDYVMEKEMEGNVKEVVEEKVVDSPQLKRKVNEEEIKNGEGKASEGGEINEIAEKKENEPQVLKNGKPKEDENKKVNQKEKMSDNVAELKSTMPKSGNAPSDVQSSSAAVKSPQMSHGGPPRHSNLRRVNRNQTYVRQQSEPQSRTQQESSHSKASSSSSSSSTTLSSTVDSTDKSVTTDSNKRTKNIKPVGSPMKDASSTVDSEVVPDTKTTPSQSSQKENDSNNSVGENSTIISGPTSISQTSREGSRGRGRGRRGRGGSRRGVSGNSNVHRGASSFSRGSSEERRGNSKSGRGGFRGGSYNRGSAHRSGLHENSFHNMRYVKPGLDGAGTTNKESVATTTTKVDTGAT